MLLDPLTGEWTLAGISRETRPNEYLRGAEEHCAFCPGHEDRTPPEIARIAQSGGTWSARAFANKYPAVAPPDGTHEVIVDSPSHEREITLDGMTLWRERFIAARAFADNAYPILFKNVGERAGATIRHPHAQLVVLTRVPPRALAMREAWQQSTGCTLCNELRDARSSPVLELPGVAAFTRSTSRFSNSLFIVPHECAPSLDRATEGGYAAVARALIMVSETLARHDGGIPYNIVMANEGHWYCEVVPRYFTLAGFELATGSFIRTGSAQEASHMWRQMIAPPHGPL